MKRLLLTLLALIVVIGILAGASFAGYRFGYQQGVLAASNGEITAPPFARGADFHWERMPMHRFGNDLERGFYPGIGPGGFRMMFPGRGFGFFSPIRLLIQLAIFGFIIWLLYKLHTGWRLSFTRAKLESTRAEPVQPVESETRSTEEQSN